MGPLDAGDGEGDDAGGVEGGAGVGVGVRGGALDLPGPSGGVVSPPPGPVVMGARLTGGTTVPPAGALWRGCGRTVTDGPGTSTTDGASRSRT